MYEKRIGLTYETCYAPGAELGGFTMKRAVLYIRVIQVLLGHAKLDTTALYTCVATKTIREVVSPLDHLVKVLKAAAPPA